MPEKHDIYTATEDTGAAKLPHPSVAVIVPAYNAEAWLADCIRSVQLQTFKDWNLIIVDDGSPDRSREIAEEFALKDSRIRVISRKNGGLSAARNTGLMHVGDIPYVTFLDADDFLHPEYLASLMEMQEGRSDRISCLSYFRPYHTATPGNGTPGEMRECLKDMPSKPATGYPLIRMTPDEAVENILYQRVLDNSAWGKLYPREMVPPGIFTEGIGYEDLDSFYRIFPGAREIVYRALPYYGYRRNPESYLSVFTERRADVLDVAERMEKYMSDHHPHLVKASHSRLLSAYFNIFMLASHHDSIRYEKLIERSMAGIRKYRKESLFNPEVRMKNKIGIIASYLGGSRILRLLSRFYV